MNIRELEPKTDHDGWLAMRSALWPDCTPERHAAEMRDYASRGGPFATFVAADSDGYACGFVEASIRAGADGCESDRVGYIEGIFVQPAIRRRGVGRSLVAAAERWAVSRGCAEMASDCHHDNDASIRFHQQLGFDIAEQLIHFRRDISSESLEQ